MSTKAVIVDLDGVAFNDRPRFSAATEKWDGESVVKKEKINWDIVFDNELVAKDPPIEGAPEATQRLQKDYTIVYLTTRSEVCEDGTRQALTSNGFAIDGAILSMRGKKDRRSSHVVKREAINELREELDLDFIAAVDDDFDGSLKPMYEGEGIKHYYTLDALMADLEA